MSGAEASWDPVPASQRYIEQWATTKRNLINKKVTEAGQWIGGQASGWWNDPVGMVNKVNKVAGDRLAETDQLNASAFADPRNPAKVTDVDAFNALHEQMFDRAGSIMPAGIMKERGGQWVSQHAGGPAELAKKIQEMGIVETPVVGQWIDSALKKYIQNDMATAGDPLRALANKGIVNEEKVLNLTRKPIPSQEIKWNRTEAGYDPKGTSGETPQGRWWENAMDNMVLNRSAEKVKGLVNAEKNPWLDKVDPATRIHTIHMPQAVDYQPLTKMVMDLEDDITKGVLRPEQLNKVSVSDAMQRSHEKLLAKIAERKNTGLTVHKQYDDGFKWVELGPKPGEAADVAKTRVEGLLKAEGDNMQNCVGGYCDRVLRGSTKIYSLRNPNNGSHVTVEVTPPRYTEVKRIQDMTPEDIASLPIDAPRLKDPTVFLRHPDGKTQISGRSFEESMTMTKPSIIQIRGKQNSTKISPGYQKMVDDFIGDPTQWGLIKK